MSPHARPPAPVFGSFGSRLCASTSIWSASYAIEEDTRRDKRVIKQMASFSTPSLKADDGYCVSIPWGMEFGMKGKLQKSVVIEIFFWHQLKFVQAFGLEYLQML